MSKKEWIYQDETKYGIYQNKSCGTNNESSVVLEMTNPRNFRIDGDTNSTGKNFSSLKTEIPIEVFDRMATSWCEKRGICNAVTAPENATKFTTKSVSDRLINGMLYYMPMFYVVAAGVTAGVWLF